jgi:hypothetical protein
MTASCLDVQRKETKLQPLRKLYKENTTLSTNFLTSVTTHIVNKLTATLGFEDFFLL